MAIGAKTMAEKKAIVTHLTALQEIASMKVLCSDKTGTLTTANMNIIFDKIWTMPGSGYSKEDILTWAAIASNPNNKVRGIRGRAKLGGSIPGASACRTI